MMKKNILAFILASFMIFPVACQQEQAIGGAESSVTQKGNIKLVKVVTNSAEIRNGVSADAPVLQSIDKNSKLNVVNEVANWYAVKLPNNKIGFVPKSQCKPIVAQGENTGAPAQGNVTTQRTTPQAPAPQGTTPQDTTPQDTAPQQTTQEGTTPKTPDTATNLSQLTTEEQRMLDLVNKARAQNNVPPLKADVQVANVARVKSQDMIDNNYFSHNSPKYGSPFDMLKSFGIDYIQAGENIAGNQTVEKAHNALMNSPGHRKNILSPDYTHIGIGIRKGGTYGNMFTQMFVSRPQ